jgi:hypothetical protein
VHAAETATGVQWRLLRRRFSLRLRRMERGLCAGALPPEPLPERAASSAMPTRQPPKALYGRRYPLHPLPRHRGSAAAPHRRQRRGRQLHPPRPGPHPGRLRPTRPTRLPPWRCCRTGSRPTGRPASRARSTPPCGARAAGRVALFPPRPVGPDAGVGPVRGSDAGARGAGEASVGRVMEPESPAAQSGDGSRRGCRLDGGNRAAPFGPCGGRGPTAPNYRLHKRLDATAAVAREARLGKAGCGCALRAAGHALHTRHGRRTPRPAANLARCPTPNRSHCRLVRSP